MSVRIMGEVWGLAIPREQKFVLIALADHADHEGNHVFPSLGLIAWKTDYSSRQLRRIMSELEKAGLIVPTERRKGATTEYRIDLSAAARKAPRLAVPGRPPKPPDILSQTEKTPDILSQKPGDIPEKPRTFCHKTPDILSQPSFLYNEPSEELLGEESKPGRRAAPLPSLEEAVSHFVEAGSTETQGRKFWHYYESKGWLVGKARMTRWRSAAASWMLKDAPPRASPDLSPESRAARNLAAITSAPRGTK